MLATCFGLIFSKPLSSSSKNSAQRKKQTGIATNTEVTIQ